MDPEDTLEEKHDYLKTWLEQHKKAQDVAPYVQKNLELTEWELKAIRDCPEEVKETFPLPENVFHRDLAFTKNSLPMIPDYDKGRVMDATAVSTSGNSVIYSLVSDAFRLGTPEAIKYSEQHSNSYRELQRSQDRPKEVLKLLEKLKHSTILDRYNKAERAFLLLKAGTGERSAVALQLRNVLDGMKGILFERARMDPKENMTWKVMAGRLAKGDSGSAEHNVIIEQESIRSVLIDRLSGIAKDREGKTFRDIEDIWSRVLDHIYTVLSLAKV
jgi:hypothetical protein